ncbi:MAG: signal peptide peptidase SppA [Syntrophobacter sp.]
MKASGCLVAFLILVLIGGVVVYLMSDYEFSVKNNRIGVVEVKGTITSSQELVKQIKEFRKDASVRAILVRVDSPGGAIGPSQEIYTEIKRTIQTKPVVASMGGVAASGGYYISCAANHIVANPGTITGSIGVIIYFPNFRELFEKIGYQMTTIKSGQFKDIGNPSREMTPAEKDLIQTTINESYAQFVRDVALSRHLPEDQVRPVADGRIIMGEKAQQLKLVDELGNFEDAVNKAAELGKIEGEPDIIYAKKKKRSVMDFLLGSDVSERVNDIIYDSSAFLRYQLPDFAR